MVKNLLSFFDRLEDRVRIKLSHSPILYSLVGAVGIILLWKGVWEVAEHVPLLHGWGSIFAGVMILLLSGLLVSFFIGDSIIISGFRREKKLADKTEKEIIAVEQSATTQILEKLEHLEDEVESLSGRPQQRQGTAPML